MPVGPVAPITAIFIMINAALKVENAWRFRSVPSTAGDGM
jgi:hypothetical protein